MWKLRSKAVPVDSAITKLKIPMVSRCSCCNDPNIESVDHLFANGELASTVLSFFASRLNLSQFGNSLNATISARKQSSNSHSQIGLLKSIISSCICWEIWLHRNDRRFHEVALNPSRVISKVRRWILELSSLLVPKVNPSFHDSLCLIRPFCSWFPPF